MTDEQKPTPDQCKAFTLALGECWHFPERYGKIFVCVLCKKEVPLEPHPTYSHADEILAKMREKLGEEKFNKFFIYLVDSLEIDGAGKYNVIYEFMNCYIFNPAELIGKAIEYLKEKGE